MIRGLWWKLLAVALMVYVFVAGMLVPLKPGVEAASPGQLVAGAEGVVSVRGYNTRFDDLPAGSPPRAWLKLASEGEDEEAVLALEADDVTVRSARELDLRFRVPARLPAGALNNRASLIIDDPLDGAFVLPEAVRIAESATLTGPPAPGAWTDAVADLHATSGMTYPYRGLLGETIRNQYFHVSLWFALMLLMLAAAIYAGRYLRSGDPEHDRRSVALTQAGLVFGFLGLLTGMLWANYTWGKPWSGDVKQNMTAIALLIYAAYFVLRGSLPGEQQQARVGAAYNLFAFAMLIPLLYVIPRMRDSLHPGAGGNPGFGGEDLDNTMRMVFYPGIIGFTLLGLWIAQLSWRVQRLRSRD